MSSGWSELRKFPFYNRNGGLFPMNDTDFIVVPPKNRGTSTDGIYKYIAKKNTWKNMIRYNKYDTRQNHSVTFDSEKKLLFCCDDGGYVDTIDLNSKCKQHLHTIYGINHIKMIYIENNIHLIGKKNYCVEHWKFNINASCKDNKFILVHEFPMIGCKIIDYHLLSIKSTNSILLFYDCWDYDVSTRALQIHEYSLIHTTWNKWDASIPDFCCSAVITTNDERYLIFIGDRCNEIYIYDFKNKQFKCSDIKCPSNMSYTAIIMNNEHRNKLITQGFVRECYKLKEYKHLQHLPWYLVELMSKWVGLGQMLHIIAASGYHWTISVGKIIESI